MQYLGCLKAQSFEIMKQEGLKYNFQSFLSIIYAKLHQIFHIFIMVVKLVVLAEMDIIRV